MMVVKNVALFEDRHLFPDYVTDYVFGKDKSWSPLDFIAFQQAAERRLLAWKAEGITGINLYLTGLTSATVAAINACYVCKMYLKLFYNNFLVNEWTPQRILFFEDKSKLNDLSSREKEIYEQFRQKDAELSLQEKKSIIETKKREQEYLRNLKSVENVTLVTDDTKNRGGFSIADCVKKRNK